MKFQLEETKRTALWRQQAKNCVEQAGWGLTVRLVQRNGDRVSGTLEMLVSDPTQIAMFNDAPAGAEFEIRVMPAK